MKVSIVAIASTLLAATLVAAHGDAAAILAANEARGLTTESIQQQSKAVAGSVVEDTKQQSDDFGGLSAAEIAAEEASDLTLYERDFERKDRRRNKWTVYKDAYLTFYWGHQLDNPACGGPTPNENEPVVAAKLSWGYAACGDEVHIHWKGKMVKATVVDDCATCTQHNHHFDLSRGLFKKLENLDAGVVQGAHVRVIKKNHRKN